MKRAAIICFTDFVGEPRVIRTIEALKDRYDITLYSCGKTMNGIKCEDVSGMDKDNDEINFHHNYPSWLKRIAAVILKISGYSFQSRKYYKRQYWSAGRKELLAKVKEKNYDLVIGHGIYTLPVLAGLNTKTVFNAHEYYLKEFEESENWKKYVQPYYKFILDNYLTKISLMFCVSKLIQDEYQKDYAVKSVEVTNATAFYDLKPIVTGSVINIIHHGAAIRTRQLELMGEMMDYLGEHYTLTFMLTRHDNEYLDELKDRFGNTKNIFFKEAVRVSEIAGVCNTFDIGLFILPPVNFNWYYALPNKLYEFIQGRLCVAVSPNPDMKRVVEENELGVVSKDYTAQGMAAGILKLTPERILYHKNKSHDCARVLNAGRTQKIILEEIAKLVN